MKPEVSNTEVILSTLKVSIWYIPPLLFSIYIDVTASQMDISGIITLIELPGLLFMVILYGPHGYWPHWLPGVTAFVFYFITTFFIVRGMKNKQSGKISSYDTVESMPRKQV